MPTKTRKVRSKKHTDHWDEVAVYLRRHGDLQYKPIWKYPSSQRFILKQVGGEEKYHTINDQTFEYNEDVNLDGRLIALYGKWNGSKECFRIDFDIHTNGQKYAILSSLDGNKACSTDGSAKSANILRAAVELAREKGAHWVDLSDASKICKDVGVPPVSLANYSMLSRGQTWYETIYPFQSDEPELVEDIREQVRTKSWNDVITALRIRHPVRCRNMLRDMPMSLSSISLDEPGSIMKVIRSIPRAARCSFLYKYMDNIFDALSIRSLDGRVWWLPLTPDADRPPPYVPMDTITIERNGYEE